MAMELPHRTRSCAGLSGDWASREQPPPRSKIHVRCSSARLLTRGPWSKSTGNSRKSESELRMSFYPLHRRVQLQLDLIVANDEPVLRPSKHSPLGQPSPPIGTTILHFA